MATDYPELRRVGKFIYETWEGRPDLPAWFSFAKGTPAAVGIEAAEAFIDLQFEAAIAIDQGKVAGKDQYGSVERERVESLGFKPIWTPGGFQV